MRSSRLLAAASVLGLLGVTVAACGSNGSGATGESQPGQLTRVTYRGPAYTGGWDTPLYYAAKLGYFKDAGLDVTFQPSAGSSQTVTDVDTGGAQFGMTTSTSLIVADSQGAKVKSVAAAVGKSTFGYYVPAGSGIASIGQLKGHTIDTTSANAPQMYASLSAAAGLQPGEIKPVLASITSTVPVYLSKKVDATYSTVFVQATVNASRPSKFLLEADAGYSPPGYLLVAGDSYISAHPGTVKAFVRAVLRGFQAAMMDPGAATQALVADNPEIPASEALGELKAMIPFYCSKSQAGAAYGLNNPRDWELAAGQVEKSGKLPSLPAAALYTNTAFSGGKNDVATC